MSGDGTNNSGRDVTLARDDAVAKGVTINGLVILSERPMPWNPEHTNPPGGLAKYFRDNVIGGPGAFVIVAENFKSFGQAHHQEADRRDRRGAGRRPPILARRIALGRCAATAARGCGLPAERIRSPLNREAASFDSFQTAAVWNRSKLLIYHRNLA